MIHTLVLTYHNGRKFEVSVDIKIDQQEIVNRMADRARKSRSGKASALNGAVKVKLLSSKEVV